MTSTAVQVVMLTDEQLKAEIRATSDYLDRLLAESVRRREESS